MEGISLYIFNFLQLLSISSVFVLIGWLLNEKKRLTFHVAFMSLFIGIIMLSTCFAIFKTGGKTIMLGFLFFLTALFFEGRKKELLTKNDADKKQIPISLGLLFGIVIVFTWSFLTLGQFDAFPYYIPNGTSIQPNDYLINVFRSHYLGTTGEENYYHIFNTFDEAYHSPKPYHYIEMWMTVALNNIFGGLAAEKFVLLSNTLFHLTSFLGILALWEKYVSVKWYHLFFSGAFLFMAGLHLPFYESFGISNFSLPIFTHRMKMCVYYPFLLAFLLYYKETNPTFSILLLSGLMLATVVVAPALLGGIGLLLLYQFFIQKNRNTALKTGGYIAMIAIFIFVFYKTTDSGQFNIRENAGASELSSNLIKSLVDAPFQKIMIMLKLLLKEAVLYLPLLGFIGVAFSQKGKLLSQKKGVLIVSIGVIMSGAFAYALFAGQKDANQLFFNIANSLLNVFLIWTLIKLITSLPTNQPLVKFPKKYYVAGMVGVLIFSIQFLKAIKTNLYPSFSKDYYSETYLESIKEYVLLDHKPNIGAAIKGEKDYRSSFSKQTAAYTLGYYLAFMENGSMAINISDFDIQNLNKDDLRDRSTNLFCRFVETEKEKKNFISIGQSQLDFIQKYNLDFIIISKNGILRPEVQRIIKKEIIDEISGERFLLIEVV